MRLPPCFWLMLTCAALSASCRRSHHDDLSRYEATCTDSCERAQECTPSVDVEACASKCRDEVGTIGARLRSDYLEEIDQCVADAECSELGEEAFDNGCRGRAKKRVGASLKAIELCDQLVNASFRCNDAAPLVADASSCIEGFKIFNDRTLGKALGCRLAECDDITQCFARTFGFPTSTAPAASEPE